ncbi:MAG: hypothetical protein ACRECN_06535, partial [Methylocella sp.]
CTLFRSTTTSFSRGVDIIKYDLYQISLFVILAVKAHARGIFLVDQIGAQESNAFAQTVLCIGDLLRIRNSSKAIGAPAI